MASSATALPWVALLLLVAAAAAATPARHSTFNPNRNIGRFGGFNSLPSSRIQQLERFRGGAVDDESDYDDYDDYDSEEEEAEPIFVKTKKLAAATKIATAKKTAQRTAVNKAKVSAAMSKSSGRATAAAVPAKKQGGSWYKRTVPYIIRACLNPFTLVAMTKAYFVSLMDVNYLKEVSNYFCTICSISCVHCLSKMRPRSMYIPWASFYFIH